MKALKELENKENEYARQIEIYDTGVTQRKEAKLAEDIAKQQLILEERKAKLEAKAGGKARDKAFEDMMRTTVSTQRMSSLTNTEMEARRNGTRRRR